MIHILIGRRLQQAEAQAGPRRVLVQAHRHQHVARLGRSRVARRPSAHRHTLQVQRNHQRLALQLLKADIRGVRRPRRACAIHARARNRKNSRLKPVAQRRYPLHRSILQALHRQLHGLAQPHNPGHILRARALAPLVAAAHHQRINRRSAAHVHRAHALGSVHLVRADGAQMAPEPPHVERNLTRALHRVDMEVGSRFRGNLSDLFHRLQHARLVVGQHHADQGSAGLAEPRLGPHRPSNLLGIDEPVRPRRNKRHLRARAPPRAPPHAAPPSAQSTS